MRIATFDIEANGFLEDVTQVWCAVVKEHGGETKSFDPSNINELCSYLEKFDVLIGHHCIAYDFPVLRKIFGWDYKGIKVDTLLMSRTQRPDRVSPALLKNKSAGPHSVEAWAVRLGKQQKVEHEEWDKFSPEMLVRCQVDVEIQYDIYHALLKEGKGEGWAEAHKLNNKLFHYLQMQEEYGWLIDQKHLEKCLYFLNRWIGLIDAAITPKLPLVLEIEEGKRDGDVNWVRKPFKKDGSYSQATLSWLETATPGHTVVGPFSRVSFRRISLDKNSEVKKFLLDSGWEPLEWNVNNDGKRTSPKLSKDDDFNGIQGSLGRLVAKRIQCRQRRGVIEGWRDSIRPDGRISARVAGMATTGRIRHSGIVNVPSPSSNAFFAKWMRKLFSSRDGFTLIGTDSKGNQIRQLAARMGDPDFTAAVLYGTSKEGTDLHSLNQKRAGVASRNLAKNFFYGFIFGAGDTKIGKIIGGDSAAGRALKEEYLNGLPKLKELIERETTAWRASAQKSINKKTGRVEYRNGYITGLDGRPILVESEHTILVYFLQSDEAIQMAAAYCWLHKQFEKLGWKWKEDYGFVIWMHDEWQFEVRDELVEVASKLSEEAIAWAGRYFKIACPHEGESKIGKNWLETH